MKRISILAILLVGIAFSQKMIAQNEKSNNHKIPKYSGCVNDYEEIFDKGEVEELKILINKHKQKTTNEIAIVSTKSFKPFDSLDDYAKELANFWNKNNRNFDNGVIIVFGRKLRKIEIYIGSGLKGILTDEEKKKIINEIILPEFRSRDIHKGIKNGLVEIIKELEK